MTSSKDIIKNLTLMGYLPPGTHLKSSARRNPERFIKTALNNAWCNILIRNVPTRSVPREQLRAEDITPQHIFETLCEFGDARHVIQVTPTCYMAYATDAEEIAEQLNGNTIEGQVLDVSYNHLANPLEVKNTEIVVQESGWKFTDLALIIWTMFVILAATGMVW